MHSRQTILNLPQDKGTLMLDVPYRFQPGDRGWLFWASRRAALAASYSLMICRYTRGRAANESPAPHETLTPRTIVLQSLGCRRPAGSVHRANGTVRVG